MPTVHRFDGLRVVIYPNDHSPAHVHVMGQDVEAIFALNCPIGPVSLRESYGFATAQLRAVKAVLDGLVGHLCKEWMRIHGSD